MQCPKTKEVTNRKRKEDKERKTATYTSVTKQSLSAPNIPTTPSDMTTIHAKTYSCMLFAMLMDVENPSSFQTELDDFFNQFDKN